jgi:chaperonin GroES
MSENLDMSDLNNEALKKKSLKEILGGDYNKADLFDEEEQKKIETMVYDTYETDKMSRIEREQRWKDILKIVKEEKVEQIEGIDGNRAKIIYPLIKEACKKYSTKAYPLLIKDGNIVKAKAIGSDDGKIALNPKDGQPILHPATQQPVYLKKPNKKIDKAQRRIQFENFLLLNETKGIASYETSFDELLYRLPLLGTYFKKVYFDSNVNKICVEGLFPQNVIVNNKALDNKYTVFSQELYLSYNDIVAKQNTGVFLDIDLKTILDDSVESETDEQKEERAFAEFKECPQLFIEQHRWLDLDQDGFMEPYIVVIHKDSQKLFGIYARFTKDDITYKGKKIVNIKARDYFVKYGFYPTTDGDYYCDGLGDLLFHTNNVVDTLLNQLVDAGTLANKSGGFISKAFKRRAGSMKLKIGEWRFVDMFGSLKDAILPIDHKEPSVVLFSLLQFILTSAKDLIGLNPAMSQDMNPNIAPTTMMALVQEGAEEFKAVYKRIYRSLKVEINLIEDIIRDNVDEVFSKMYAEVLDDEEAEFEKDFNNKDYDVIPVADSSMTTDFEKNAKVNFLIQLSQLPNFAPLFKQESLLRDILQTINYHNINSVVQIPPPPAPDPQLKLKEMELQLKSQQIQSETAMKVEKEKSERLRIQIANQDLLIKQAEGMLKAKELDYTLALKEAEIENKVADSINKIASANKSNAEAGASTKESEAQVEALYEPKGK